MNKIIKKGRPANHAFPLRNHKPLYFVGLTICTGYTDGTCKYHKMSVGVDPEERKTNHSNLVQRLADDAVDQFKTSFQIWNEEGTHQNVEFMKVNSIDGVKVNRVVTSK